MIYKEIFAKRLLLLRTAHDLSNSELSHLLNLKSKTSISNLEGQRVFPSFPLLTDIADWFCVSTDWLIGRSNDAYRNDMLLLLEKKFLEELYIDNAFTSNKYGRHCISFDFITECSLYNNEILRIETLSLPLRANILFMFYWFRHLEHEIFILKHPFSSIKNSVYSLKTTFQELLNYSENSALKTYRQGSIYIDLLEKILLTKEITTPVFDISTPIEKEQ